MWYFVLVIFLACNQSHRIEIGGFETQEVCDKASQELIVLTPNKTWLTTGCELDTDQIK